MANGHSAMANDVPDCPFTMGHCQPAFLIQQFRNQQLPIPPVTSL